MPLSSFPDGRISQVIVRAREMMEPLSTQRSIRESVRDMFLGRLRRLVSIERDLSLALEVGDRLMVERAMTSTYWDCCRLGGRRHARRILGLSDH
jgi:hypothetical protein